MTVRYVVAWWAGVLEETLQRNDAKPHWSMPTAELLGLLLVEVGELVVALAGVDREAIRAEAADVAAFAMFIADRYADRPTVERGRHADYD